MKIAGVVILKIKSQFYSEKIKIVGFIYGSEERNPEVSKVIKILNWERCDSVAEVRAFINICVYYFLWIEYFVLIAALIY